MKARASLSYKIILWFFLNIAVVGAILFFSFDLDFRVGPDSAIFGKFRNRMPILAFSIVRDMSVTEYSEWAHLLATYSDVYQVDLALVDLNGDHLAGTAMTLPFRVRARLVNSFNAGPDLHCDENRCVLAGPPWRGNVGMNPCRSAGISGPDEPADDSLRSIAIGGDEAWPGPVADDRSHQNEQPGHIDSEACEQNPDHPGQRCPIANDGRNIHFKMKTHGPTFYWSVMRLPGTHSTPDRRTRVALVARSRSITGNGLFMDPTPWMTMGVVLLILSILLWIPMIRHMTLPLSQMTAVTETISRGIFDVRADDRRSDEIGRLGRAINDMADRLSRMIRGQKRFLGDAAHELASPLARLQLGLGILEDSVEPANLPRVEALKDEVSQMADLVNGLLSFSRSDAISGRVSLGKINLFDAVSCVIEQEIPDKSVAVLLDVDREMDILADFELVRRIFGNIIRNSVRYAGNAGPVTIRATRVDGFARIVVEDSGPGVPEEMLPQIFDPFYRVESSRTREGGGVGLGLAIVATAVSACNGRVAASNRQSGGFSVTVEIPLA